MVDPKNVLRDVKTILLGVTMPALSLRTMFNIETPPLDRTFGRVVRGRLVANPALRNVQVVAKKLRKLPVKHRSSETPNVKLSDVKNLKDLVPAVGLENLDVGSKKVDILYNAASTRDKLEFYLAIVRHLIKVGESGPITDISLEAQSEIEDSDDEDDEPEGEGAEAAEGSAEDDALLNIGSPIRLKSGARAPSDPLRTRAFAKVILNIERIRLKTIKIPELIDEDAAERNKGKFSEDQMGEMKGLDTEFYLAMKNYTTPFFKAYTMEEYRLALKIGFRTKDRDLFKVAAFNFYYPNMIHTPVTRSMIAHDFTFCIAWLGMWRRMKEEKKRDEIRAEAIADLKPNEEVERDLPEDLKALRTANAGSKTREPGEGLEVDCMICFRSLLPKHQIVTDACHHLSCKECIVTYMEYRKFLEFASCPCCTKKIKCWMYRKDYKYAKKKLMSSGALKKNIPEQFYGCVDSPKLFADSKLMRYIAQLEQEELEAMADEDYTDDEEDDEYV